MEEKITQAINIVNQGGIIIYPTDTAFGIGCRIDNESSIKRLFHLRRRPESQATPVLVNSVEMAKRYWLSLPDAVEQKILNAYWPGAVTVILPCDVVKVPELVRGGTSTLGVRVPNHETTLSLISGIQVPLLGPSANFHGDPTPYHFKDLNPELVKLVDYVLPGECSVKQASTVIDCSVTPWRVVRKGAVEIEV